MVDLHTNLTVVRWRWLSWGPVGGPKIYWTLTSETEVKVQYNLELVKAEFGFVQRNLEPQSPLRYPADKVQLHMNGYTPQACPVENTSVQ